MEAESHTPPECSPTLSKKERVELILARMRDAPAASTREEALAMMAEIFEDVEDRHSGVRPPNGERLYPPVKEMEREVEGMPSLRRYRHTNHYTLIADNGAIIIRSFVRGTVGGTVKIVAERTEFEKPGRDGAVIPPME